MHRVAGLKIRRYLPLLGFCFLFIGLAAHMLGHAWVGEQFAQIGLVGIAASVIIDEDR